MPRVKIARKHQRRERLPTPSSDDEIPPENCVDKCPILIGKSVDLASFNFDVHSFHIEDYFVVMGWVSIVTLDKKAYPNLMKEFHQCMAYSPGSEDGQWVAKTKGFDAESGPSTLPFEGGEKMDKDGDEEDTPLPSHPRERASSHMPSSSTSDFSFTEDHYNLLNGRIDSLTTTVDDLQHTMDGLQNTAASLQHSVEGLHHSINGLTSLLQQVLASQQAIYSHLDIVFPLPPLLEN
ncbi:hypothetical protein Adt_13965 [Abeliophyllum distichum]|uniref:Uncharacterized protein n=1 Tax=Abeliophyllum distichum TaxID=126358 RepID=A0ABD1TYR9_9LAMI